MTPARPRNVDAGRLRPAVQPPARSSATPGPGAHPPGRRPADTRLAGWR